MDPRIDLKSIAEKNEYVLKLASALDSKNEIVKKQIVEILSTLCSHSELGFQRTIDVLEKFKENTNEKYRFKVLVNELDKGSSLDYKVAILVLINNILSLSKCEGDRIQFRSELIGLNILPTFDRLRSIGKTVPDLQGQLEKFMEQKEYDDKVIQETDGINLSSHIALFYALLHRVSNTPQEICFLNILQHLLLIETKDVLSDVMWKTAETFVHRSSLIENQEDANRLLRAPNFQKNACPHCRFDIVSQRKLSLLQNDTTVATIHHDSPDVSAAPPPIPPPPPPPMMFHPQIAITDLSSLSPSPKNVSIHSSLPIPPPPPRETQRTSPINRNIISCNKRSKTPEVSAQIMKTLPQQETPTPRTKMKTINWNKIPPNKVIGTNNIWSRVAEFSPVTEMNWDEMEGLFCQQLTQGSPKFDTPDNRRSRRDEITLLDGKKSLNVNIFLKQFRSTNSEITRMIHDGEHETIGLEKLKGLLKILPEFDELEMLRNFDGDKMKLGNAEKFLLELMQVPNFKLRIECMLLKEEFSANVSYLEPSINAMLFAGEDLMGNKALQEVLYLIVLMGNFLNAGGYAGNAAGVKLASLQKLTEIRANKPGMNLIHFVALQAEKKDKKLLQFADRMNHLENASKMTIEQLNNEIIALDKRISNICRHINLPTTEEDIKLQMRDFLQLAENEIKLLHGAMNELEKMRIRLADFFCEDSAQFKIEECFKIFYHFCEKFKGATKDNEKRRTLEEQATLRRKQREDQLTQKRQQFSQYSNATYDSEQQNSFLMDPPTVSYDIRFSPAMNRRRMGSFNNNSTSNQGYDFGREEGSPDITPNGSLRRRRSRVLSEEDEDNLMDFLRSAGHDNTLRERKSANGYGSLDRSWARRARTGNAKSRPDLLNVDFGPDRERPMSPSPTIERKVHAEQEEAKPRAISKEWRQKIESWLHANDHEQDGKSIDEEYRRSMRRVTNIKRSLENEKEGENSGKLDTLLEEKQPAQNLSPTGKKDSLEPYRRVYPEWKPLSTIEKVDNLETTDSLPGMIYVQTKPVDKTSMRKSLLNSTESSSDGHCKRSIAKDDKIKKSLSLETTPGEVNKQCIYICSNDEGITSTSQLNRTTSSVYICPDLQIKTEESFQDASNQTRQRSVNLTNNKGEIDSDNIETPPTVRKSFNGSIKKTNISEHVPLGDGQFDRFSSARRTRRFKRPTDLNTSPTGDEPLPQCEVNDLEESKNTKKDVVSRIGKIGKSISKISQEDVREAIRSLKSPTPEHEWKLKEPIGLVPSVKITTHELNDEGFEETQSLVSDTPSLTTSSCNEDSKSKKIDGSEKVINLNVTSLKRKPIRPSNQLQTLLSRNQQSLERSRSLRNGANLTGPRGTNTIVQRTNSLRKPDDLQQKLSLKSLANKRLDVERSSSRTSLRSSRSSLNSAVSTNTVKKMPQKVPSNETMQSQAKRPMSAHKDNLVSSKPSTRVPASRSSSSGSSIQSLRKPPISGTKLPSPSGLTSNRSKISPSSSSSIVKNNDLTSSTRQNNNSNFMRPTTATKARQKLKQK